MEFAESANPRASCFFYLLVDLNLNSFYSPNHELLISNNGISFDISGSWSCLVKANRKGISKSRPLHAQTGSHLLWRIEKPGALQSAVSYQITQNRRNQNTFTCVGFLTPVNLRRQLNNSLTRGSFHDHIWECCRVHRNYH